MSLPDDPLLKVVDEYVTEKINKGEWPHKTDEQIQVIKLRFQIGYRRAASLHQEIIGKYSPDKLPQWQIHSGPIPETLSPGPGYWERLLSILERIANVLEGKDVPF